MTRRLATLLLYTLCAQACSSRTNLARTIAPGNFSIESVSSPVESVFPGQLSVPVTVHLSNQDERPVTALLVNLTFHTPSGPADADYNVQPAPGNTSTLAAGAETVMVFWVSVAGQASEGQVLIDAHASAARAGELPEVFEGAEEPAQWRVGGMELPNALQVTSVSSIHHSVQPGQVNIPLSVGVENHSADPLTLLTVTPRFTSGGVDVTAEYSVSAGNDNVFILAPYGTTTWTFTVALHSDGTQGNIALGATASASRDDGALAHALFAVSPGEWMVAARPGLVVTRAEDEDDTGGSPTLSAAGGASDLSLREALFIAAESGAAYITFDPTLFAASSPSSIVLDETLGPLPVLSADGTTIDAGNLGVVIDGDSSPTLSPILSVHANSVTLRGFTMRGSNPAQTCLQITQGNDTVVQGMSFKGCGTDKNVDTAVHFASGNRLLIDSCTFVGGTRTTMGSAAISMDVRHSLFTQMNGTALDIGGTNFTVEDSEFRSVAGFAIIIRGTASSGNLRRNTIADIAAYDTGASGIEIQGAATDIVIEGNDLWSSAGSVWSQFTAWGVHVADSAAQGVQLRDNKYRCLKVTAELEQGANAGLSSPTIIDFDGSTATGSAIQSGTVTVLALRETWQADGQVQIAAGIDWTYTLTSPSHGVIAMLEDSAGQSSGHSEPWVLPLIVDTASDDMDGPGSMLQPVEAGATMSLREALTLSNNMCELDVINFDSVVFAAPTSIVLGSGTAPYDPLPVITESSVRIDGNGTEEIISGGFDTRFIAAGHAPGLLNIEAHGVTLTGLSIQESAAACIGRSTPRAFSGTTVSNSLLIDCSGTGLVGIALGNLTVANNEIRAVRTGIQLNSQSGSTTISNNLIHHVTGTCIDKAVANNLSIKDNRIAFCGAKGISALSFAGFSIDISGNDFFEIGSSAMDIAPGYGKILHNTIVRARVGVTLHGAFTTTLFLHNNLFAHTTLYGINNPEERVLLETHNLYFNMAGNGTTGANAIGNSVIMPAPSSVFLDPQFEDLDAGLLRPTAAAIDAGIDMGLDRNGVSPGSYNGAAPDIGAFETP